MTQPAVGTVLTLAVDAASQAIVGIVNFVDPGGQYFNMVQALVDGHDQGGTHVPLKTGNQIGVDPVTRKIKTTDAPVVIPPPTDPVENPSQNASNQWNLQGDWAVNVPAWPNLMIQNLFPFRNGSVNQ